MKKLGIALGAIVAISVLSVSAEDEDQWSDRISIKGDLRNRLENIDQEGKSSRTRWRIRGRVSIDGEVNESLDVKARFASGSDDPVSSNETLDGGFSSKGFHLDRFYFDFHPEDYVEGLHILGGKMAMPFVVIKDLIWDGDLNLEGFAAQYSTGEDIKLMANAGAFFAEERSSASDTTLYGAQLATEIDGDVKILAGASLYHWDNMKGFPTLFDSEDDFGNASTAVIDPMTMMPSGELLYAEDFSEVELFAKLGLDVGIPVSIYGDYVVNTDASKDDTGYMVGITLGKAKNPGSAQFDYNYRELEKNAVVGAFSDSDFAGGGTNGEGHKLQAKYQLAKNWQFAASYFMNSIDPDKKDTDYDRLQVDLIAKF